MIEDIHELKDRTPMTLSTALAQRDEARLRVNLISLAIGHAMIYPAGERHADLVTAILEALQPVR